MILRGKNPIKRSILTKTDGFVAFVGEIKNNEFNKKEFEDPRLQLKKNKIREIKRLFIIIN